MVFELLRDLLWPATGPLLAQRNPRDVVLPRGTTIAL